ncbi:MAG: ADP-ribosylation factor-like protein [Gemmatimonadaceae bacterium]
MIQKKVCMVGMYGTGKTSLVQRFVRSIFSPRYLSTVGVKIDRKDIAVDGQIVHFMLWDLEGRDQHHDVNPSYLKGASGIIFVVDGTRPDTLSETMQLRERVLGEIGAVPSVLASTRPTSPMSGALRRLTHGLSRVSGGTSSERALAPETASNRCSCGWLARSCHRPRPND